MPKRPVKQRTISGKPVTKQHFRNEIVQIVLRLTQTTTDKIAKRLGEEYESAEGLRIVRSTVNTLVKHGDLERVSRGIYAARRFDSVYQKDRLDHFDSCLERVVIELGGLATQAEILEAFGMRPSKKNNDEAAGDIHFSSGYRQIRRALRASTRLARLDFIHRKAVYAVREPLFSQLPLTGYWMGQLLHWGMPHVLEYFHYQSSTRNLVELLASNFRRVGEAFQALRDSSEVGLAELVDNPAIASALREMVWNLVTYYYEDAKREVELDMERNGNFDQSSYAPLVERHMGICILYDFENGSRRVHLAAPPSLYTAVAARFHVHAGALSRGMVMPAVPHLAAFEVGKMLGAVPPLALESEAVCDTPAKFGTSEINDEFIKALEAEVIRLECANRSSPDWWTCSDANRDETVSIDRFGQVSERFLDKLEQEVSEFRWLQVAEEGTGR